MNEYIEKINKNEAYYEKESLSIKDKYNEYIIVGTRIKEGLDSSYIESTFAQSFSKHFQSQAQSLLKDKLLEKTNNNYTLTKEGEHIANTIALKLMK